jgi:hypothetical protein
MMRIVLRFAVVVGLLVAIRWISMQTAAQVAPQNNGLRSPAAALTALGRKFNGAGSCSNAQCHGGSKEQTNGETFSNEWTMWSSGIDPMADPHHGKTWAALKGAQGARIAQGLGIANATKSDRCLSCHALDVPTALQGKNYKLSEGVTCEACHGPSDKWLDPHSTKGWYAQQKQHMHFQALLTTTGLYDTRPVHARAERCTSCHLAIDPDLVAKGHPQPTFELSYFSETYPNRHWHEPDGYFKAKLWSGGQQVALYEALEQLADRAAKNSPGVADAYNQVLVHYQMFNEFLKVALPGQATALSVAMQNLQKAFAAKKGIDAAALAAAQVDDKLAAAVEANEPNKSSTISILNGVAAQSDFAVKFGRVAQDQQSYAVYALYSGFASAEKPADADAVTGLIGDKLFADPAPAAQQYIQNLAAVKAKLPH